MSKEKDSIYKPYQSKLVRKFNAKGYVKALMGKGYRKRLDWQYLHDCAEARTGLADFGREDYGSGLSVLIESLRKEKSLHPFGCNSAVEMMVISLANRLRLEAFSRENPVIEQQHIGKPIWIVGLPRTGSTLLHNLLALDEENRTLKRWEALRPAPVSADAEQDVRVRRWAAKKSTDAIEGLSPGLLAKHAMGWDQPEECVVLFADMFRSQLFGFRYGIASYMQWLYQQDMTQAYQYYARQVRALHFQQPASRWVFKAPFHALFIPAIESVFPQANYIHLHRDPRKVLPSVASLQSSVQGIAAKSINLNGLGKNVLDECGLAIERAQDARKSIDSERVMDIDFSDIVADPMAVIEAIYSKWNMSLSDYSRDKMRRYLAANPKDKGGKHRYASTDFGLSDQLIYDSCSDYINNCCGTAV